MTAFWTKQSSCPSKLTMTNVTFTQPMQVQVRQNTKMEGKGDELCVDLLTYPPAIYWIWNEVSVSSSLIAVPCFSFVKFEIACLCTDTLESVCFLVFEATYYTDCVTSFLCSALLPPPSYLPSCTCFCPNTYFMWGMIVYFPCALKPRHNLVWMLWYPFKMIYKCFLYFLAHDRFVWDCCNICAQCLEIFFSEDK
jgi:hypothetical protein